MDMLGKGRVDQVKFGGASSIQTLGSRRLSREFGDIIDSVNATRSEVMAIDKTWDVFANPMNRFCRSDQVNYVHHDVPVTYFRPATRRITPSHRQPRYRIRSMARAVVRGIVWAAESEGQAGDR
jgi:hypothetical protein